MLLFIIFIDKVKLKRIKYFLFVMVSALILVGVLLVVFVAVIGGCDGGNQLTGGTVGLPDENSEEERPMVWRNGTGTAGITTYIN